MSKPEDFWKEEMPQILKEEINSAVNSQYELYKNEIQKVHDTLLFDAEQKLAQLVKLPLETKIRYRVCSGENFEGVNSSEEWEVVTLREFIEMTEKGKAKVSIERYLEFVTEGLADILIEEPDYLRKYKDNLIRDQFSYTDHYLSLGTGSGLATIVPEYTIEGNGLSKLKNNPLSEVDQPIIDI